MGQRDDNFWLKYLGCTGIIHHDRIKTDLRKKALGAISQLGIKARVRELGRYKNWNLAAKTRCLVRLMII